MHTFESETNVQKLLNLKICLLDHAFPFLYLHSLMHFSQDIVLNKIHIAVVVKEFGIDPKIDILRYSRAEPLAGGYGPWEILNLPVMKEIILIC